MKNIAFFLVFLFSASAGAEKVLLVGDPQYGWFGNPACKFERQNFQKIIKMINEENFDALVILGDMADSYPKGRNDRRSRQAILFLEDVKKVKNARVIYVAGNHDLGDFPNAETIKRFEKNFSVPAWYAFHFGGHKFLVINTTLLKNHKRMPQLYENQMKFIKENRDARIVLGHHPMFYKNPNENNKYYSWPTRVRNDILPLFAPGTYFFSGHTHKPFQKMTGSLHHINVGTCCAPWKRGGTSYGVLEINGKEIRYTEKKF